MNFRQLQDAKGSHTENFNANKVLNISDIKFWDIYHGTNDSNTQLVLSQELFWENNIDFLPSLMLFFFLCS